MGDHDAEARPIYHCPGLQTLILMLISVGLMMLILCWIMVRDWGLVQEEVTDFVTGPGAAVSQAIPGLVSQ